MPFPCRCKPQNNSNQIMAEEGAIVADSIAGKGIMKSDKKEMAKITNETFRIVWLI